MRAACVDSVTEYVDICMDVSLLGETHVVVVLTFRPWLLGPQPRDWLMAT